MSVAGWIYLVPMPLIFLVVARYVGREERRLDESEWAESAVLGAIAATIAWPAAVAGSVLYGLVLVATADLPWQRRAARLTKARAEVKRLESELLEEAGT